MRRKELRSSSELKLLQICHPATSTPAPTSTPSFLLPLKMLDDPALACQLLEAALQLPPEPLQQAPAFLHPGWQLQQSGRLEYASRAAQQLDGGGYRVAVAWEVGVPPQLVRANGAHNALNV